MMELMEAPPPPNANGFDEFLQTSRTGRRNAVPEIDPPAVDEVDLPLAVEKLTCSDTSAESSNTKNDNLSPGSKISATETTAAQSAEESGT